ncbi:MAG: PAS domain S-box protein [Cytophagales bacterium]|nr:PAS domain S-box protein [Cytophagales bacterium]
MKVGNKIAIFVSFIVLLSVVTMGLLSYNFSEQMLRRKYLDDLVNANRTRAEELADFHQRQRSVSRSVSEMRGVIDAIKTVPYGQAGTAAGEWSEELLKKITPYLKLEGVRGISFVNSRRELIFGSETQVSLEQPTVYLDPSGFDYGKKADGSSLGSVYLSEKQHRINAYSRLFVGGELFYLILHLDASPVLRLAGSIPGIGETAETVLARNEGDKLVFVAKPAFKEIYTESSGIYYGKERSGGLQMATQGISGTNEVIDYRGKKVLAAWSQLPDLKWGIATKVDTAEVSGVLRNYILKIASVGLLLVVLTFFVSLSLSKPLMSRLQYLKKILQHMSRGVLPNSIEKRGGDEFGEMAETVDGVVQSLRRTAEFAYQIGEGNYNTKYKPVGEQDILGNSLLGMRDNIRSSEERDDERNWIVSGVAKVGDILRQNENLEIIGDNLLEYVVNRVSAVQGAFYVVDESDVESIINMRSCYAYQKKKYIQTSFRMAEGLVGQTAIEQELIFRTEIPEDYPYITSGLLGDQRPESILLMPLITDEQVYGVLELAAFHVLSERQINFVQEISVMVARTIFNVKVNERTMTLLKESRNMSQELREKQEILRQNAEEMQATQEELQRTNSQLEEQIEEVNRGQKRTQMLLENASEVITIYEKDGTVRYVSPSVERILGYSQSEMNTTDILEYVVEEDKQKVKKAFDELVLNPHRPMSIQYRVKQKDGDVLWVEAAGNNLLSNPAIQGLVLNTRDITMRLRAEREERMRSKMQSLSENSLDLITRLDAEGTVFYINPTIKNLTGKPASSYLNKPLKETDIPKSVLNEWDELMEEVVNSGEKITRELDFPALEGDRIMQVNAIPEFDTEENIESVLVVSHDITEQKLAELEIKSTNKKITESINYARRIQGAILPGDAQIHRQLPDSFIVYRARDVVSGDFPWYLEVDNQIFIAAVDCTGHGVPGALISLIGYFLLNDIVRSQRIFDPGVILDQLDQQVTKTLRQDQEGATGKDGMDIALCRIDKEKGEVVFAGAHRPLFWVSEGILNEIKGNKFPIGGGRYRNQTNFDSHVVKVKPGDAIYFCSDGYIDQFGGEKNRKFGSKRLRNLISDISSLKMEEQHEEFAQVWEGWKGEQKQTDDMLLIGIKF